MAVVLPLGGTVSLVARLSHVAIDHASFETARRFYT